MSAANIDGVDEARAIGEQDFGKAAGGGTDIDADMIFDIDRILLERATELDAAA